MREWFSGLMAALMLAATPALAAPCTGKGNVEAAVPVPTEDAAGLQFARSMIPVMLPGTSSALPAALTCSRATVSTALGDYAIGGNNDDPFPRMAVRADGKPGPVVYLATSPQAPGTVALVVYDAGSSAIVKRFYSGIPTDRLLADDIKAALAQDTGIMRYDARSHLVSYPFITSSQIPPPAPSSSVTTAGPQVLIAGNGNPDLLDVANGMVHKPSGFACPESFDGLAVLLMSVDPQADHLTCNYRAGTDLAYHEGDPIRYQIRLSKLAPGETTRSVFDQLNAGGRAALHIIGDHKPPLATGPAPAPEFVAYWDTDREGVQGVWVGHAGGWVVLVRAQYPPSAVNDVEAGRIARILFELAAKQVK